jgi:hypothetical protein
VGDRGRERGEKNDCHCTPKLKLEDSIDKDKRVNGENLLFSFNKFINLQIEGAKI